MENIVSPTPIFLVDISLQAGNDYSLAPTCLLKVLANFPIVTLDAMASSSNTIWCKLYSKYKSLNSLGIDFLFQSLDSSEFFYVFPPVSMALSTIRFLESQNIEGILIIPIWPSSSWYNTFFGSHCYQLVQKLFVFRPNLVPNINSPSCLTNIVTYDAAALHFNF